MRALMSCEPGGTETLKMMEVEAAVAGKGQVLIAVKACGVNYPDVLTIQDKYQVKTPRPFAPGAEVAGGPAGWRNMSPSAPIAAATCRTACPSRMRR